MTLFAAVVMTLLEGWFFVGTGELTYYRWNLLWSFVSYVLGGLLIYGHHQWYAGESKRPARGNSNDAAH